MRRRKPRSSHTIYNHARGDGWILVGQDGMEQITNGHQVTLVLYYTDEQRVESHDVRLTPNTHGVDVFLRQYLDVGGKLGPYEGTQPEAHTDYSEQPQPVRMQRHATDIYAAASDARGLSETLSVKAAETFGSTWDEKIERDWRERVTGVGKGRAKRIVSEI